MAYLIVLWRTNERQRERERDRKRERERERGERERERDRKRERERGALCLLFAKARSVLQEYDQSLTQVSAFRTRDQGQALTHV